MHGLDACARRVFPFLSRTSASSVLPTSTSNSNSISELLRMARNNRKTAAKIRGSKKQAPSKTPRGRRNAGTNDNSPRIGAPYFAHETLDPAIYPACKSLVGTTLEPFNISSLDIASHVVYDSSGYAEPFSSLKRHKNPRSVSVTYSKCGRRCSTACRWTISEPDSHRARRGRIGRCSTR